MARSDIQAGRAFVELLLKDKGFVKGLSAASTRLRSFGKGVSVFGAAVSAAGSAIVAPLLAIATKFSNVGSALYDMKQRTNESVETLSFLSYAADQTGASIGGIEKAIHSARKEGKSLEELASQIVSIADPAMQSQKAIELFGKKAGPALVPLLRDLPALRKRFDELGIAMSDESAERADRLGDVFGDLKAVVNSAAMAIGDAMADEISNAIEVITSIAMVTRNWIRENRELFATALKIGVVVAGIGAAVTVLGGSLAAIGIAVAAFNAALGVGAALLGAIVSPVGAVVAAVSYLAYWFVTSTEAGQNMVESLAGWFQDLSSIAVEAFGGIRDAFAAGDLVLAGEVAWKGLKALWLEGTQTIRDYWRDFSFGVIDVFHKTVSGIKSLWTELVAWLEKKIATATGVVNKNIVKIGTIMEVVTGQLSIKDAARIQSLANKFVDSNTGKQQNGIDAQKDADLAAIAQQKKDAIAAISQAKTEAGKASDAELEKAKKELQELTGKARAAAINRKIGDRKGFEMPAFDGSQIKSQIFGTFSAAALLAAGSGNGNSFEKALSKFDEKQARRDGALLRAVNRGGRIR